MFLHPKLLTLTREHNENTMGIESQVNDVISLLKSS